MTNTTEALDEIKNFVREHKYLVHEDYAVLTLHDGVEYRFRHQRTDSPFPYSLEGDTRAMVFESIGELRGWLRCYRSMSIAHYSPTCHKTIEQTG